MISLIVFSLVLVGIPVYYLVSWSESSRIRSIITRIAYIINLIFLYPCIYLTFTKIIQHDPLNWVWTRSFLGSTMLIICLRFVFLPYILSGLWTIIYFRELKDNNFPKAGTILFVIMFIVMIMGLVSVEHVSLAGMAI